MSASHFTHDFLVRLHDTDAAGLLFYGNLFRHTQEAYEAFMAALGFPLDVLLREGRWLLPIAHAEADYRRPMRHGDSMRMALRVLDLRRRSYAVGYDFLSAEGELAARATTIHVLVEASAVGGQLAAAEVLPDALHAALSRYWEG